MKQQGSMAKGLALVAVATLISGAARASWDENVPGEFSGQVQLSTDYITRGLSQTSSGAQLQGTLTYSVPVGETASAYAGVWASNTSINTAGIAGGESLSDNENSIEFDPFIGFAGGIGETNLSYDVGYFQYTFPEAPAAYDYGEWYGVLSYAADWLTTTTSAYWSDDYFGDYAGDGDSLAVEATFAATLPWSVSPSATVGKQYIDVPSDQEAAFGTDNGDYLYWNVGIATEFKALTLDLRYWDTDTDDALAVACFRAEDCNERVVLSATRSF